MRKKCSEIVMHVLSQSICSGSGGRLRELLRIVCVHDSHRILRGIRSNQPGPGRLTVPTCPHLRRDICQKRWHRHSKAFEHKVLGGIILFGPLDSTVSFLGVINEHRTQVQFCFC